jgi:hypothetical protein
MPSLLMLMQGRGCPARLIDNAVVNVQRDRVRVASTIASQAIAIVPGIPARTDLRSSAASLQTIGPSREIRVTPEHSGEGRPSLALEERGFEPRCMTSSPPGKTLDQPIATNRVPARR